MRKVWRAIRFSSVGVFFTGIIGVIQGCSVEREGALFAVLLFLLNFCSVPTVDEPTGLPVPAFIFVLGNQGSVDDVTGKCFGNSAAHVIESNTAPASVSVTKIRLALRHAGTANGTFSMRFIALENIGGQTWRTDAFQDVSLDWKLACPNDGVNDCIIDLPAPLSFEAGEALGFKKVSGGGAFCVSTTTGAVGDTRGKNPCGVFLGSSCNFNFTVVNMLIAGGN